MSVRKNESRCQNTAFLLSNIQIWIHWMDALKRREKDILNLVLLYLGLGDVKFDVPSGRIRLLVHDYEANII